MIFIFFVAMLFIGYDRVPWRLLVNIICSRTRRNIRALLKKEHKPAELSGSRYQENKKGLQEIAKLKLKLKREDII